MEIGLKHKCACWLKHLPAAASIENCEQCFPARRMKGIRGEDNFVTAWKNWLQNRQMRIKYTKLMKKIK